jgi:hypothetical protein
MRMARLQRNTLAVSAIGLGLVRARALGRRRAYDFGGRSVFVTGGVITQWPIQKAIFTRKTSSPGAPNSLPVSRLKTKWPGSRVSSCCRVHTA